MAMAAFLLKTILESSKELLELAVPDDGAGELLQESELVVGVVSSSISGCGKIVKLLE